jgi:hypothetical protein
MEPTPESVDALYREEIAAARRLTPEEKLLAGRRLFDGACERLRATIRASFPRASDEEVEALLRQVIRAAERLGVL